MYMCNINVDIKFSARDALLDQARSISKNVLGYRFLLFLRLSDCEYRYWSDDVVFFFVFHFILFKSFNLREKNMS